MASRYEGSYSGLGEMLNEEFMVAEMRRRAEAGKTFAEGIAPVYPGTKKWPNPHIGRYKAGFIVESGSHGGAKHNRAWAALANTAPETLPVEYGTKNNPARHVLLRALMAMGD